MPMFRHASVTVFVSKFHFKDNLIFAIILIPGAMKNILHIVYMNSWLLFTINNAS